MNTIRLPVTALSAIALLCGAPAHSQTPEKIYAQDRANCLAGRTQEDRPTCLKEAGAALSQARHGGLGQDTPSSLAANAERRCDWVEAEDKVACLRLVHGEGTVSGSVDGGGILREIVTRSDAASAVAK